MSTNRECPEQTAWMRMRISTFAVGIWYKGLFNHVEIHLYTANISMLIFLQLIQRWAYISESTPSGLADEFILIVAFVYYRLICRRGIELGLSYVCL